MRARKVDVREVARILGMWQPQAMSVELFTIDRERLREQVAQALIEGLGLEGDEAESFFVTVTSNIYAERVS